MEINSVSYKDLDYIISNKIPLKSNSCNDFIILSYKNSYEVLVKFLDTDTKAVVRLGHIRNGNVRDKNAPSVYNIGVVGNKYPVWEGGTRTKEYAHWLGMLTRCYNEGYQSRQVTYKGCSVIGSFIYYEQFYEWCQEQVGYNSNDGKGISFHLDKDLLIKGNKVYSEDTCVFLPKEINNVLLTSKSSRGEYPIGVSYDESLRSYKASLSVHGKLRNVGRYSTIDMAFNAYKKAKELYIKELAEKWKGKIDERAYEALMNYQVEIAD